MPVEIQADASAGNWWVPMLNRSWIRRILDDVRTPYRIGPVLLVLSLIPLIAFYFNGSVPSTTTELLTQLTKNCVIYCLLAIGASLVLATGQIDLSSVGVAVLSGVIFAFRLSFTDHITLGGVLSGILLCLLFGLASGVAVAFCFSKFKAPMLILTWALGSIYIMASILLAGTTSIKAPHDVSGIWLPEALPNNFWQPEHTGFNLAWFAIVAAIVIPSLTGLGDRARAVGASETSARYAGVLTNRVHYQAFIFNALASALAGVFAAFYLNRASTSDLRGNELVPIAIAVLGGTSLAGGYLAVLSVVAAAFFWTAVRLLGPQLPSVFPRLDTFQAEIGNVLFFTVFIGVSLLFGKLLMPPLPKVFARQES